MNNTYECYECHGVFEKGWSDEEATKEQKENWGNAPDNEMEILCDACYKEFMEWYKVQLN